MMKKMIVLICAALFVGTPLYASTDTPVVLDFGSVTEMAASRSLIVNSAKQNIETGRQALKEAKGYQAGKIGIAAEYLRLNDIISIASPSVTIPSQVPVLGGQSLAVPPVEVAPQDLIHLRLEAGYPIYTSGMLDYAAAQAEAGVSAYEALAGDTTANVVYQANSIFLAALLTRQVIDVNQQALDSYKKHLDDAQKAYAAGVVAKYDVIRAETAVKEQEKRLTESKNQHELALAALRSILLLPQDTAIQLNAALYEISEPLPLAQAQNQAMSENSLLKALGFKAQSEMSAEKFEKASAKPQVTGISEAELLRGNIAQTDPAWTVGVRVTMDIFNGGVTKAKAAQKASEQKQTLLDKEETQNQIKLAIQSSYLDMDSAKSALESSRKAKELAQESLRLARKRFEVGTGTSLEVIDANVALSSADLGICQSTYILERAYLTLHRYMGDIIEVSKEMKQ
ncbi:MAG: TolC family protein [Armatimonadota bacterium]